MEKRNNFYADELNMERIEEAIGYLAENLTLKEVLKVVREISYDMVSYWDKENCARIYKDNRFSALNREQACRIQRGLSTMCDLFAQSVIDAREFDDDYLEKWLDGGSLQYRIEELQSTITQLENTIAYLKEGNNV